MKTKVSWLIVYLSGGYQSITANEDGQPQVLECT